LPYSILQTLNLPGELQLSKKSEGSLPFLVANGDTAFNQGLQPTGFPLPLQTGG
jgi:hypothetical protein